ncbi:MAG: hypothetical protein PHO26_09905 [Dehalococcoidia bacterium]|nr:hypothetical protein [Dehalococcoidia bacterium]MDD5494166.1 hypothetical protein [Dehalococcoidia bacterium]
MPLGAQGAARAPGKSGRLGWGKRETLRSSIPSLFPPARPVRDAQERKRHNGTVYGRGGGID